MYPNRILSPSSICVPIQDVAPDKDARIGSGDTVPFVKWAGGKRAVLRHLLLACAGARSTWVLIRR